MYNLGLVRIKRGSHGPANAILIRSAYAQNPLSALVDVSREASGLTLVRIA